VTEPVSNADELERLRVEVALVRVENERVRSDIDRIRVEVEQRTAELAKANAERDEARREACQLEVNWNFVCSQMNEKRFRKLTLDPNAVAVERGWDCFAPHANTNDVPVQNGGE